MKKIINLFLVLSLLLTCCVITASADDRAYEYEESWEITASSTWSSNPITKAFDGDVNTYWHSNYQAENGQVVSQDKVPYQITIVFPEAKAISGFLYTPRPMGMSDAGRALAYKLYLAENENDTPYLVKEGKFENNTETKEVKLSANMKAAKLVFEITEAVRNYGTMSEFGVLKADSSLKDAALSDVGAKSEKPEITAPDTGDGVYYKYNSGWEITASSQSGGGNVLKAFDGDINTFWHSNYTSEGSTITGQDKEPFFITVVFPEAISISGFCYTPRPAGMSESGRALAYRFHISDTEDGEMIVAMEGDFENSPNPKTVKFPCNVKVKKVMFEITSGVRNYGTMSELEFAKPLGNYKDVPIAEFLEYKKSNLYYAIPKDGMRAHSESVWNEAHDASKVLDDNTGTFWHENPNDKAPITLDIDLKEEYELLGFSYFPRKEDINKGQWKKYNVYASLDGEDYELVLENATMEIKYQEVLEFFESPVRCRYLTFEILDYHHHCACADLQFFESAKNKDKREAESYEKYVMQIDNPVMKVTHGTEPEKEVTLDVAPYLDNGTTMIPLRGLLEEMGATLTWDGNTQSIKVDAKKATVELQIMNTRVFVTNGQYGRVRYTLKGSAPKIKNSRTFIPLRFVSENLGYTVTWIGETKTIIVETDKETKTVDANN